MNNLADRIWVWCNKRPTGKVLWYAMSMGYWWFAGIMFGVCAMGLITSAIPVALGVVGLLGSGALLFQGWMMDWEKGYTDAAHNRYLERRQEMFEKVAKEKTKCQ